jgi:hypothetical protein
MRTGFPIGVLLLAVALCAIVAAPVLAGSPYVEGPTVSVQQTANSGLPAELAQSPQTDVSSIPQQGLEYDPVLGRMISQISASEIYRSTSDLQSFSTRVYPSAGNRQAASYLYNRLSAIPGLDVEFQSDRYQNVIATLPGKDNPSNKAIIVGAHYDSISSDPEHAPGATDNGCGVAIVLELARVLSRYQFNQTIQFAFWNAEEQRIMGSTDFVGAGSENSMSIPLYFNYDSACYDPDNRYVLDVIFNEEAESFAELATEYNSLYDINFDLTFNEHKDGISDHVSFRDAGIPVMMTASESDAPQAHTPYDTIDLVSTSYARKNAQLGMIILADTAEYRVRTFGLNGGMDFSDVMSLFNQMTWLAAANEPITAPDCSGDGLVTAV